MGNKTMEDIAKEARVSKSTVSRALGDDPRVNENTRKRIKKLAKKMNYQPHKAAQALANKNTNVIGIVFPKIPRSIADPFFLEFLQGIGEVAVVSGYSLTLLNDSSDNNDYNKLEKIFHKHNVDGIILTEPRTNDSRVTYLKKEGLPFVFLGNPMGDQDAYWVETDNRSGAYQAVDYLIKAGHKRIATITGPMGLVAGKYRLQGYKDALLDKGLAVNPDFIINADFTQKGAYRAAKKLLLSKDFTAIFAANDLMALGAIKALKEQGLTIPGDIAIMGYDGIQIGEFIDPPLTTISQPGKKMGEIATELLLKLIQGEYISENHVLLSPELIVRDSV
ncbi:LacI family DNA-binding transcriptional regulator [Halocella sp. SP3-1]|uniref:LacI family DNA-binding transcriptional regulator n=1 Tax=Halocella sp. SP3-1 TaxID=2382161 RepID=UPI000F7582BC|nr:LacI family DNA-binding transcriptional regulator [Halocella sp. SP3-1]AZO93176.1 LacI family transcriptional regulator [Halocella sp. SP3-1]